MNEEVLFTESQRFKQWWIWLPLLGLNGLVMYPWFSQIINEQINISNTLHYNSFLVSLAIMIAITLLFTIFRLDTIIRRDGIYLRFFPFHLKFKHYAWNDLTKSFVREYSALSEYGGWGLRVGFSGKGTAWNVSGNKGLQLEFKDGKRLLIGTNQPEQICETLKNWGNLMNKRV